MRQGAKRIAASVGALGFLGASVAVILILGKNVDTAQDEAFTARLNEIAVLDRTVNIDVLRARFGMLNSYDGITASERRLALAISDLAAPSYLDDVDRQAVTASLVKLRTALDEKRERVETFKAKNSVLKNSMRFTPTIAREITDGRAEVTLSHLLAWDVSSDRKYEKKIAEDADTFDANNEKERPLVTHLRAIATTKPVVDELVRELVDVQVERDIQAVASAYHNGFATIEGKEITMRALLYAVSFLLAVAVGSVLWRLRKSAVALERANATLEQRVEERTRALDARTRRMAMVLDNVQQGLVIADKLGRLDDERSAAFDKLGARQQRAPTLESWLRALNPAQADWLAVGWPDLFEDVMPFEVVADQLPRRVTSGDRTLELGYRAIEDAAGRVERVLVVVSDITDKINRERAESETRDMLSLIDLLVADRASFIEFVQETDALVASVVKRGADRRVLLRDLHTLKGNTALIGIRALSAHCHELEERVVEVGGLAPDAAASLTHAWTRLRSRVSAFVDDKRPIEIDAAEHRQLIADVDTLDRQALKKRIERLKHEAAEKRLSRMADQASGLADRLKKSVEIVVDAPGVRLEREAMQQIWGTFSHLIRNAVDHGIEDAELRAAMGKPERACITLSARATSDEVTLEVADDGPGVNWDKLKERARTLGLKTETRDDLVAAMFTDSVSTKDATTDVSGRGVGLAAVRNAVIGAGGTIEVHSEPGRGTRFTIRVSSRAHEEIRPAAA